jgi:hypothetical protein
MAYLIGNWNNLARIVFESFSGLGLKAAGSALSAADFLRLGRIAQVGIDAGRPILESISGLMGYIAFFENFVQISVLLFAWVVVLLAFFILAIQLFVTLIEFKLTTLAGFVLIPFGLFGKTAFAAERVLGDFISSGVKVLVLAVVVGIGSTLFAQFTAGFGGKPRESWRTPSGPSARKHDATGVGGLVDLRPVPRFERMNGGVLGLRSQVFSDADVKIGVGFPPDEQEGKSERLKSERRAVLAATSSKNW